MIGVPFVQGFFVSFVTEEAGDSQESMSSSGKRIGHGLTSCNVRCMPWFRE